MREGLSCRCAAEKNVSSVNVNPMRQWTQNEATMRFECEPAHSEKSLRVVLRDPFFSRSELGAPVFATLRVKQNNYAEECTANNK